MDSSSHGKGCCRGSRAPPIRNWLESPFAMSQQRGRQTGNCTRQAGGNPGQHRGKSLCGHSASAISKVEARCRRVTHHQPDATRLMCCNALRGTIAPANCSAPAVLTLPTTSSVMRSKRFIANCGASRHWSRLVSDHRKSQRLGGRRNASRADHSGGGDLSAWRRVNCQAGMHHQWGIPRWHSGHFLIPPTQGARQSAVMLS